MKLSDFNVGDVFSWKDAHWVLLDWNRGRALALRKTAVLALQFDAKGKNNWGKSTLNEWLNGWYLERHLDGEALNPFRMYAGPSLDDTAVVKVGLLGVRPYRKYSKPKSATWKFFAPDERIYWTANTCDGIRGDGLICLSGQSCPGMYLAAHEYAQVRPLICLGAGQEVEGTRKAASAKSEEVFEEPIF